MSEAEQAAFNADDEDLVQQALTQVRRQTAAWTPPIVEHIAYGSIEHLTIWYAYADEAALQAATAQGQTTAVGQLTLTALRDLGYPMEDLSEGQIGFVSKATVDAAGGPEAYFRR
jgi:hypothetical protein